MKFVNETFVDEKQRSINHWISPRKTRQTNAIPSPIRKIFWTRMVHRETIFNILKRFCSSQRINIQDRQQYEQSSDQKTILKSQQSKLFSLFSSSDNRYGINSEQNDSNAQPIFSNQHQRNLWQSNQIIVFFYWTQFSAYKWTAKQQAITIEFEFALNHPTLGHRVYNMQISLFDLI